MKNKERKNNTQPTEPSKQTPNGFSSFIWIPNYEWPIRKNCVVINHTDVVHSEWEWVSEPQSEEKHIQIGK